MFKRKNKFDNNNNNIIKTLDIVDLFIYLIYASFNDNILSDCVEMAGGRGIVAHKILQLVEFSFSSQHPVELSVQQQYPLSIQDVTIYKSKFFKQSAFSIFKFV